MPVCVAFPEHVLYRHVQPGRPPALPGAQQPGRGGLRKGFLRRRREAAFGGERTALRCLRDGLFHPLLRDGLSERRRHARGRLHSPRPQRRGARSDPLIVAGGICAMANPEPMSPFFDLFIMGDVEACLPPFIERYLRRGRRQRDE